MSDYSQPRVAAHITRTFAALSDTFIYTQLMHLRDYQAVMLTRRAQHLEHFPGVHTVAFAQHASPLARGVSNALYSGLRMMSGFERNFFCRTLARLQPRVAHVHFAVEAAYFSSVLHRSRVPVIVSCYGYDVSSFPRRYCGLGQRYLQAAWTAGDLFLAMSADMRSDMVKLGCPPDRIRIHYHGINLDRFPFVERREEVACPRILFVGRLGDERKGVDDVIRAFALVARENPGVELRVVGEGRFRPQYEQLAASLGIATRVSFPGFVRHDQLVQEYRAAHIFCHPSVTSSAGDKEGIPGTIVEAMATGLPVLSTRHAGIPEMVTTGEHGFLVAERDVAGIAHGLQELLRNPELRLRWGLAAARRARERGDASRQTAVLESLYDEATEIVRGALLFPQN
jgi:colanic acid/amylovoran biosynthesis glycosyltransferase